MARKAFLSIYGTLKSAIIVSVSSSTFFVFTSMLTFLPVWDNQPCTITASAPITILTTLLLEMLTKSSIRFVSIIIPTVHSASRICTGKPRQVRPGRLLQNQFNWGFLWHIFPHICLEALAIEGRALVFPFLFSIQNRMKPLLAMIALVILSLFSVVRSLCAVKSIWERNYLLEPVKAYTDAFYLLLEGNNMLRGLVLIYLDLGLHYFGAIYYCISYSGGLGFDAVRQCWLSVWYVLSWIVFVVFYQDCKNRHKKIVRDRMRARWVAERSIRTTRN